MKDATATLSAPPHAVLLLRPDTMGDLVLFSPALRQLREEWPAARIGVVMRRPYLELARLLVTGVDWVPTEIDPFTRGPGRSRTGPAP